MRSLRTVRAASTGSSRSPRPLYGLRFADGEGERDAEPEAACIGRARVPNSALVEIDPKDNRLRRAIPVGCRTIGLAIGAGRWAVFTVV